MNEFGEENQIILLRLFVDNGMHFSAAHLDVTIVKHCFKMHLIIEKLVSSGLFYQYNNDINNNCQIFLVVMELYGFRVHMLILTRVSFLL